MGAGSPGHWSGSGRAVDFYDMKGAIELIGSGLGVAIGARVGAKASASEVLVSQTVKDLVAGSGLSFEEHAETWVFTVSAGKITRVKEFATREQAVRAVSAGESAGYIPPSMT